MSAGRIIVVSFVTVTLLVAVVSIVMFARNGETARTNQAGIGLAEVHKAAAVWAETEGDGAYPVHIALLRPNKYFHTSLLRDPRLPDGTVWEVNGMDARPFMDEAQGTTVENPLDRTALVEAVEVFDASHGSPIYRFGDYWFVRLPRYEKDPSLVFGWTQTDDEGRRFIVFDSGQALRIRPAEWERTWRNDAEARGRLGLEAIEAPDA